MGYTHYFSQSRPVNVEAWKAICGDVRWLIPAAKNRGIELLYESDEPGRAPNITRDHIRFNGAGEDGHETFYIERVPTAGASNFCKTAGKPYDLVVAAILIVAQRHAPKAYSIGSDGTRAEWKQALEFVTSVLGKGYRIPSGVRR